jgi:muramoyltetrapeptide carboxypeptidase LdcA involved in peptidoglycan recycling
MIPNKLNQGDKVAIVATARAISKEELGKAVDLFESWGLDVVFGITYLKLTINLLVMILNEQVIFKR